MIFFLAGCEAKPEGQAAGVVVTDVVQVVPATDGAALPLGVAVQPSANNLDVVAHGGALFFAFRTAPTHFASTETVLYLLRSDDSGSTWILEASFAMQTDLREPRFAVVGESLFFYFAVLGENAADFEPQGTMVSERDAAGAWSAAEWLFDDGFIPWRIHPVDGGAQLVGYTGGAEIYDFGGGSDSDAEADSGGEAANDSAAPVDDDPWPDIQVQWLSSSDGRTWNAVVPGQSVVEEGGGSETDWAELADGGLVAVTRNEAGDELGFGSKICTAQAESRGAWSCVADPKKYDSPWVFSEGGAVYLVGRRNLTTTGNYDLGRTDLDFDEQALTYAAEYWGEAKRCSLWRVDPESSSVSFVLDLPSRGDTCFASGYRESAGRWVVYNYSSPIDGADVSWLEGQLGETRIYRQTLVFAE